MVKRRRGHTGLTSLACFLPRTSPWRGGGVRLLDAGAGGNAAALLAGIAAAAGAGLCTKLGVNKTTSTNASREYRCRFVPADMMHTTNLQMASCYDRLICNN